MHQRSPVNDKLDRDEAAILAWIGEGNPNAQPLASDEKALPEQDVTTTFCLLSALGSAS